MCQTCCAVDPPARREKDGRGRDGIDGHLLFVSHRCDRPVPLRWGSGRPTWRFARLPRPRAARGNDVRRAVIPIFARLPPASADVGRGEITASEGPEKSQKVSARSARFALLGMTKVWDFKQKDCGWIVVQRLFIHSQAQESLHAGCAIVKVDAASNGARKGVQAVEQRERAAIGDGEVKDDQRSVQEELGNKTIL